MCVFCICVRERETSMCEEERDVFVGFSVYVCVKERERETSVCVRESERDREMCVCSVYVCVKEREREKNKRVCVFVYSNTHPKC